MAFLLVSPGNVAMLLCSRSHVVSVAHLSYYSSLKRALICLGTIYFLYTIPLTAAASFANSQNLNQLFPKLQHIEQGNHTLLTANLLSSLIAALIWALFFS